MIKRKEECCAIRLGKKDALLTAPVAFGHLILNMRKPKGSMQLHPISRVRSRGDWREADPLAIQP